MSISHLLILLWAFSFSSAFLLRLDPLTGTTFAETALQSSIASCGACFDIKLKNLDPFTGFWMLKGRTQK